MKKLIYILIIWFGATSCLTVSRIQKNCDKFAQLCVTDREVETIVEYCDTTIYIRDSFYYALPSDTVTLTDTVTINEKGAQLAPVEKTNGVITGRAWVLNSVLHQKFWLNDSSIVIPFEDSVVVTNKILTTTDTRYIELPPERFVPKFYKFTFWFFMVAVLAISLFVLSRIYSAKIKMLINKLKQK